MTPDLVCLGNLTIDDVVLPDGTERPGCTGGDALYAALAARPFCPATEIVAPVGSDFPQALLDQISTAGFSANGLPRRELPTLHNRVVYSSGDDRDWTMYASEMAFEELSPGPDDIPANYREARGFLVLAMALSAQERLVATLAEGTALTLLDPQEDYIAGNEARLREMIGRVDVFMPSAEEVRRLLGTSQWADAACTFASWGPRLVVIKLGADGVLIHDGTRGSQLWLPALTGYQVVDTTGAGDSFCGGFAAQLLNDPENVEAAARAGAAAASVAISDYGATALLETPAEVVLRRFREAPRAVSQEES